MAHHAIARGEVKLNGRVVLGGHRDHERVAFLEKAAALDTGVVPAHVNSIPHILGDAIEDLAIPHRQAGA